MTKIKICGLTRPCDIAAANAVKPDYIGFVFAKSRRQVTPQQAADLRAALNPEIVAVGVFVDETAENILALCGENDKNGTRGIIDAIQLHGNEDDNFIRALRAKTTATIIKAVSVEKKGDAQAWENCAADFLLLDNKHGGTGQVFDWGLIGEVKKPYFLAGGLSPENVSQAINALAPFAVDVSSGVEVDGAKCPEKMMLFVTSCNNPDPPTAIKSAR